jgi:hypothetical protein
MRTGGVELLFTCCAQMTYVHSVDRGRVCVLLPFTSVASSLVYSIVQHCYRVADEEVSGWQHSLNVGRTSSRMKAAAACMPHGCSVVAGSLLVLPVTCTVHAA